MQGLRQARRRCSAGLSLEGATRRRDGLSLMPWSARFDDPIPVPKGKPLVALKDAADYIIKLPKIEQHHRSWQAAIEALIMAADAAGHQAKAQEAGRADDRVVSLCHPRRP
jgi:hypothetical protein